MNNRTMPPCTVMPVLVYPEVRPAVDWLCNAFGFIERWEAKGHRAQLLVGAGAVVVVDGSVDGACGAHSIMVRVDNVDGHHARAREHEDRAALRRLVGKARHHQGICSQAIQGAIEFAQGVWRSSYRYHPNRPVM